MTGASKQTQRGTSTNSNKRLKASHLEGNSRLDRNNLNEALIGFKDEACEADELLKNLMEVCHSAARPRPSACKALMTSKREFLRKFEESTGFLHRPTKW